MRPLEQETNPEVLREYAMLATKEVERLSQLLKEAQSQRQSQEFLSTDLRDQLSRLQCKFFGSGPERVPHNRPISNAKQSEVLLHSQSEARESANCEKIKAFDNEKYFEAFYDFNELGLSELSKQYELQEGEYWEEIPGLFQTSQEITVTERVYKKVIHKQKKYRLVSSRKRAKEVIITAPGPAKVRRGCQYSVDFALSVVSDKYEYHVPLERQRRQMESAGLKVSVKSLYNLCAGVADHCNVVLEGIRQDIIRDKVASHIDETTWPLQGNKSQCYVWTLSNRSGNYYQFEPTRSGTVAEEILKGFSGCLMADGFSGYNRFKLAPNIILGNCWSHARREFFELHGSYPKESVEILDLIDELFAIERSAKTWEELKSLREEKSRLQIKKIYEWLIETRKKHLRSVGLSKAIDYSLGRWKELTAFLDNLALPLSNNDAERSLRHVVMGRKNFNGSKTINGADVATALYTVIETCKKVGIAPRAYLKYLIQTNSDKRHQPLTPLALAKKLNQESRAS
ncbi:MAG: IS66 family transposase [Bdellovibrionaceae bacterium]|nr:IS66 family transposase [Pseudobdellovibrionaceae bacterium]